MTLVEILLMAGCAGGAAVAGWFFARLTQEPTGTARLAGQEDNAGEPHPVEPDEDRSVVVRTGHSTTPGRHQVASGIVGSLKSALTTDKVYLAYQPKLDVREQAITSAEALFRWDSNTARRHSVGDLIKFVEQEAATRELTLWTFKRAVSDQLLLLESDIELTTFVNLSGGLVGDSDFTLEALDVIARVPNRIGIEITETAVIENFDRALSNLELYAAAGIEIAIDDYGTGLSSLHYLKRLPANELKIDREFVKDLTRSHRDPMIVRSTIDLAHALGMRVTAEGVDDPMQLALLKAMGCDQLQGFNVAKPMQLPAFIDYVRNFRLPETQAKSGTSPNGGSDFLKSA